MPLNDLTLAATAHNNWGEAEEMIASVEREAGLLHEIVVVDDGSREPRTSIAAKSPVRILRNDPPKCFAGAAADALEGVRTPYALLVDSDVRFLPGDFARTYEAFRADPKAAWVGFNQVTPDGRPGGAGEHFQPPPSIFARGNVARTAWQRQLEGTEPARQGAFLPMEIVYSSAVLVRMDLYRSVGGIDRAFRQSVVDYDISARLRAVGGKVGIYPDYTVQHEGHDSNTGGERRIFDTYAGYLYFYEKFYPSTRWWLRPVLSARHLMESCWCLLKADPRKSQRLKLAKAVWSGYSRRDGRIVAWS